MTARVPEFVQTAIHCYYRMSRRQQASGDARAHQSKAYHSSFDVLGSTTLGLHSVSNPK